MEPKQESVYEAEVKRPPPGRFSMPIRQQKKEAPVIAPSMHSEIESRHSQAYEQKGDSDPAYRLGKEKKVSLARAILAKNRSLKDLIVIQEVFNRPYE